MSGYIYTEQDVVEFDSDLDFSFDLIVRQFVDACEATQLDINDYTFPDDVPPAVAVVGEELERVLDKARHDVELLLASLRQAVRAVAHAAMTTDTDGQHHANPHT